MNIIIFNYSAFKYVIWKFFYENNVIIFNIGLKHWYKFALYKI